MGELHEKKLGKVIANASNRAATTVRKAISDNVRKEYIIKASDIKKTLSIKRASTGSPITIITSKGQPISLMKFSVAPKVPVSYATSGRHRKATPKVYKAKVKKSGKLKAIINAFVAKNVVMTRPETDTINKPRNWLDFGPSVPQMINNNTVKIEIVKSCNEMMEKRIKHEIERILGAN